MYASGICGIYYYCEAEVVLLFYNWFVLIRFPYLRIHNNNNNIIIIALIATPAVNNETKKKTRQCDWKIGVALL